MSVYSIEGGFESYLRHTLSATGEIMAKKKPSGGNNKGKDIDIQVKIAMIGATVTVIGTLATLIISLLNLRFQQKQFDIAQTAEARRIELTKEAEIRHIGFTHTAESYAFQLALTQTAVALQATQSLSSGGEVALVATQTALVADFAVTQTALWANAGVTQTAAANAASQTAVPGDTYTPEPTYTTEPTFTPEPSLTPTPRITFTPKPTTAAAGGGPINVRRIVLAFDATRGQNNSTVATLSIEFTGGAGPFTLTGDGIAAPQVKSVSGTFTDAGVTYNFIHFEVSTTCGSTAPFTITIKDATGQTKTVVDAPEIRCK
jgi:hypothetical protein